MFSSSGHFKGIPCPLAVDCDLPNCIFSHDQAAVQPTRRRSSTRGPAAPSQGVERPSKRSKLSGEYGGSKAQTLPTIKVPTPPIPPDGISEPGIERPAPPVTGKPALERVAKARPISPPPLKRSRISTPKPGSSEHVSTPIKKASLESLNPRMMANAPAGHSSRSLYLKKLHQILKSLNDKATDHTKYSKKKLSEAELINLALDEEEKIALEHPAVYANVIKLRMVALSKMTFEQWTSTLLKKNTSIETTNSHAKSDATLLIDSQLSIAEEIQILPRLSADQASLKRHGFVTSPPTDQQIEAAEEGVGAAMGWEECDRCKSRFQVFPDRREDGTLTSGGSCTYHYGRAVYSEGKGSTTKMFACCNQPIGSSVGCVTSPTHVFKTNDVKRLASIMQFEETPYNSQAQQAICFDCEMGYTTNGMEMIRMTAISWPEGKDLIDVLVRPLGVILDFNTRYSGVRAEDFANAAAYDISGTNPSNEKMLRIVESPMVARQLLFDLLSPTTPLIGHAIENDLNVTRIIHPVVVDTVILFPHKRGLPYRSSLRILASGILSRYIQVTGGGHDSREDARAAGDLVRVRVAKMWKQLKAAGWTFVDGRLVAPSDSVGRAPAA